ncbi:MAG: 5-aminolevulinate synthase [Alphaproteobacteria bacterium]|jgi:5-aminolevulinate synthase
MNYNNFFARKITDLKTEGRYRVFIDLKRKAGHYPTADYFSKHNQKPVTVWCSNDYLGMGQNPQVIQAAKDAIDDVGVGSGGTRNISGTSRYHVTLEAEIASLHQKESAILFTSGYVSNSAGLSTIAGQLPNCQIFSDEKNHASMIEGIRFAKSAKHIFKHCDMRDLESKLSCFPIEVPKIIAVESIYSMDGSISPLYDIVALARKYNALTYVDEVHAVGLYGNNGAGMLEQMGIMHEIDFIEATLAKGFGVVGGYIAGSKNAIDFIRSYAAGFIFTTSLPPAICAAAQKSIEFVRNCHSQRELLHKQANYLRTKLRQHQFHVLENVTHIVPLMIGDPVICKNISDILLSAYGHYAQPINYPTVPHGTERLRFTPSPNHTNAHIDSLVSALCQIRDRIGYEAFDYQDPIVSSNTNSIEFTLTNEKT